MIADTFSPRSLAPAGRSGCGGWARRGSAIEHAGAVVLIDPYSTRASPAIAWSAGSSPTWPPSRHAPRADAVIAGHTYFDHALDIPEIALRTGATASATARGGARRAAGVPAARVRDAERAPGGGASWSPRSACSSCASSRAPTPRLLLGRVPLPRRHLRLRPGPARAERYRCGAVFAVEIRVAGRRIVHLGSAELVEAGLDCRSPTCSCSAWPAGPPRSAFPRARRARPCRRARCSSRTGTISFCSLDRPAVALPAMQGERLAERLGRASRDMRMGVLPLLGEVWL